MHGKKQSKVLKYIKSKNIKSISKSNIIKNKYSKIILLISKMKNSQKIGFAIDWVATIYTLFLSYDFFIFLFFYFLKISTLQMAR